MATTRGRFDWNDVLWTFIGAFIFQLIWTITPAKYKEIYEEMAATNSGLAKVAVPCSADTFVVNQTLVHRWREVLPRVYDHLGFTQKNQ